MAKTAFATGNSLSVKRWSASLFKQAMKQIFFKNAIGTSANSFIQSRMDLSKEKGDSITFGLRMLLSGDGRTDDQFIEGSEEAMVFHDYAQLINLRSNGVLASGKMSMRRTMFDIKSEARDALAEWMAKIIDDDLVKALSGLANDIGTISAVKPNDTHRQVGGQNSSGTYLPLTSGSDHKLDELVNGTHDMGTLVISHIKRLAQLMPVQIRPIMVDGGEHYIMYVHPYQLKSLRAETAWLQAQREANLRGKTNPIFSGMAGIWDGVIIREYEKIETRAATETFDSGDDAIATSMDAARALFLGAQAGMIAWGQMPGFYEKDFDYGRVPGVATDVVYGAGKARFNSLDFAVIAVDTAITPD